MGTFKSSVLRKSFIAQKIREKTYPTAVTLATDFNKEYGKSVDPRTIASDIASLRQDYKAPIAYDYQHRGYYYTNPAFQLDVLRAESSEIPLENLLPVPMARSAVLTEWQQNLIASCVDKVLPLSNKEKNARNGKITVIPTHSKDEKIIGKEQLLLKALHTGGSVKVNELKNAPSFKHLPLPFVFYPLHLICEGENRLYFGRIAADDSVNSEIYALLYSEQLQSVDLDTHTADSSTILDFIYVQTTHNDDIEILFSENNRDVLLIFFCANSSGAGRLGEYKLLAKTEIYV